MRRLLNVKMAIAITGIVALALALSAIFIPSIGDDVSDNKREVFLSPNEVIASKAEAETTAHFLGEKFVVVFTVQYRGEYVEIGSLQVHREGMAPFEMVSDIKIVNTNLGNGISEYVYHVELMTVEAREGRSYRIKDILLLYTVLETQEIRTIDISPDFLFQTASWYGGNLESVNPRPYMPALLNNLMLKQRLFGMSVFVLILLVLSYGVYIAQKRETIEEPQAEKRPEHELLWETLMGYKDTQWLKEKSPRDRMLKVEKIVLRLLHMRRGIPPYSFWGGTPIEELGDMKDIMILAYKEKSPEYSDVVKLVEKAEKFLSEPDKERGRK